MVIPQKESLLRFGREQDLKGERGKPTYWCMPTVLPFLFSLISSLFFSVFFIIFFLFFYSVFFLLSECSVFQSFFQGTTRALL